MVEIVVPKQEIVQLSLLKIDGKNPNKMPADKFESLKKNLKRYGFIVPIITNQDYLIADGQHRLNAAIALGMTEVPIIRLPVSEVDRRMLRQILNKLRGEHDPLMDEGEFKSIFDDGMFDEFKELMAITDREEVRFLAKLKAQEESDNVDIGESLKNPKYKIERGEIWKLGNHVLMCGDATSAEDVGILMMDEKADLVFTDPPYGVSIGDKNKFLNEFQKAGKILENIQGDTKSAKELYAFLLPAFRNIYSSMKDDASFYVTAPQGGDLGMMMMMMMMDAQMPPRHVLIWMKSSPTFSMGRLDYDYKHEPILYGWKSKHNFYAAGNAKSSVWEFDKPVKNDLHPTMKPVALIQNALYNSSKDEDLVMDLFGGSGSTLIACEISNRICRMMEIEPHYCSVIIERWEQQSAKKAERIT